MFTDRRDAGRRLVRLLGHLRGEDVVVVGLPRGGVPVAEEISRDLDAPLDVILVRKLGVPFQPELGMGAIGEDGVRVLNDDIVAAVGVSTEEIAEVERRERTELERRARRYRAGRDRVGLSGRTVVIVDDGIATGSTAMAACRVAAAEGARRVILAVPVAPVGWTERLAGYADELISLATPSPFHGVGQFYQRFTQTTDEEVIAALERSAKVAAGTTDDEVVSITSGASQLAGNLTVPANPVAVIVFAHGSGSSRHSPRNRHVAEVMNQAGMATLLLDLLTADEEHDRANVFDIELLAGRLADTIRWVGRHPVLSSLEVGLFGASTGAGAALWAAADMGDAVSAVVSRGGRPDLAGARLEHVSAPTLLIVGGDDPAVIGLNREASARLPGENRLEIVPGATHLFEEPGTLDIVARLAADWFLAHLAVAAT